MMEQKIKLLIGKALSNTEILEIINGKANLISYTNIHKYKNLDHLLGKYDACVILYELRPSYGHWCCIFKLDDNTVEFFDPYGIWPDKQKKYIDKKYLKESNQKYPYLTKLMIDSPYVLTYNHYPFQQKKKGVNSCGRWCAIRLLLRILSLDKFIKLFSNNKKYSKDFYVTLLTNYI
jgi:hypothetical protein